MDNSDAELQDFFREMQRSETLSSWQAMPLEEIAIPQGGGVELVLRRRGSDAPLLIICVDARFSTTLINRIEVKGKEL
jgi:hypothetical protein